MSGRLCTDVSATCIEIDSGMPVQNPVIECTNEFDFGAALLSKFDILEAICNYLPYRDLYNMSQVNSAFATYTKSILQRRMDPICFSIGDNLPKRRYESPISPSLCIVMLDYKRLKLNSYVCLHGKHPHQVHIRKPLTEFLQDDVIISKCPIVTLSCKLIMSSFTLDRLLNGVIFPQIPNIKTSIFRIRDPKSIAGILNTEIGNNNKIKCLMAFSLFINQKLLDTFINEIRTRQPLDNYAFGGGLVRGIKSFNINGNPKKFLKKRDELVCIAFSTPKNIDVQFNAYSLIIPEDATTDLDIEQHFIDFKNHLVSRKHMIAVRITCISREEESVKDIKFFKKHFPNMTVVGFDGDGEIGWNFYKTETHSSTKRRKYNEIITLHCMSSVFIILSWGKQI